MRSEIRPHPNSLHSYQNRRGNEGLQQQCDILGGSSYQGSSSFKLDSPDCGAYSLTGTTSVHESESGRAAGNTANEK